MFSECKIDICLEEGTCPPSKTVPNQKPTAINVNADLNIVRFAQNKFEQQIQHEYQSFKGSGQAFVSLGGVNLLGSSAVVESISLVGVPWNT